MLRYERTLSEHDPDMDNFYSIIDRSRTLLNSNDWWDVNQNELSALEGKPAPEHEGLAINSEA